MWVFVDWLFAIAAALDLRLCISIKISDVILIHVVFTDMSSFVIVQKLFECICVLFLRYIHKALFFHIQLNIIVNDA